MTKIPGKAEAEDESMQGWLQGTAAGSYLRNSPAAPTSAHNQAIGEL